MHKLLPVLFFIYLNNVPFTSQLGQPVSMDFDSLTARFQFIFTVNTDIHQPTIVYINEQLNYPHGFDINVSPVNSLTWNSTSPNYYDFVPGTSTKNNTTITILITAKKLAWYSRAWNWLKKKILFWKK